MEQVLFVHKEVDVFRIPPRSGAGGWRSGEWRVADRIFTGRCRVMCHGDALEVRLEDLSNGELFGVAPVPPGQANIAVEQAADSSRNFVLRLEDVATKRHAFVGLSFADRSTAFDFNVAISDHERQRQRSAEMQKIAAAHDPLAAAQASGVVPEAAALYRSAGDLSLKEGETIKITMRKKEADGDSFLSRMGHTSGSSSSSGGRAPRLMPLAPPPGQPAGGGAGLGSFVPPPPPPAATAAAVQPRQQQSAGLDLLGLDLGAAAAAAPSAPAAALAAGTAAPGEQGWATFE